MTAQELNDAGGDGTAAGTWTLTLKHGRFQIHCARVDQGSGECGTDGDLGPDGAMIVEVGKTAGDASSVWLIYDQAMTKAVNGGCACSPTNEQLAPDRMDWSLAGHDLVLKNVWSASGFDKDLPAVNTYTLKPWKKIG